MEDFLKKWHENNEYFETLEALASLSKLFSNNTIPYLDYRLAENIFCKYFNAINEARACTAFDAKIEKLGLGIKTFILKNDKSLEKVAEFNKLKPELDGLYGKKLARKLGMFFNDRIDFAERVHCTDNKCYHIVGRCEGTLKIFNANFEKINTDQITILKNKNSNVFSFYDGFNEYSFNRSKSVLMRRFLVPKEVQIVPVEIIDDPLSRILPILSPNNTSRLTDRYTEVFATPLSSTLVPGYDYVILPLYSTKTKNKTVCERSGLNLWNANGRPRRENEVYIPVPKLIHNKYPNFFPSRGESFSLKLTEEYAVNVKICQDGGKSIMSEKNELLGKWILRDVMKQPVGKLVTFEDLLRFGVDSVRIINKHSKNSEGLQEYSLSFWASDYESYSEFCDK